MNIVGISGSIRKGNCFLALEKLLESAREEGARTRLIDLGSCRIETCQGSCHDTCHPFDENGNLLSGGWHSCTRGDDGAGVLEEMVNADAVVMASPVLFGNLSATLKTLMERSNSVASFAMEENQSFMAGKWGAAVAVGGARHAGQEIALQSIMNYYLVVQMHPVGLGEYQAPLGLSLLGDDAGSILNDQWTDYEIKKADSIEYLRAYGKKLARLEKK